MKAPTRLRRSACALAAAGSFALLTVAAEAAITRPVAAQTPSFLTPLMQDSVGYGPTPALSPDGRWLVWATDESDMHSELWIRPRAGGESKPLVAVRGVHRGPQFTPAGDRILFFSSLPQRGPSDIGMYLMTAPFDSRTGTLSGPPVQLTLDAAHEQPRFRPAVSPDGLRVAYVGTDERSDGLRVVPITGGESIDLLTLPSASAFDERPRWPVWSADGSSVIYQLQEKGGWTVKYRSSIGGGAPQMLARREGRPFGRPLPGGDVSVDVAPPSEGRPAVLRILDTEGDTMIAPLELPAVRQLGQFFPSADGETVVVSAANVTSGLHIVPTDGGPIRDAAAPRGYDWPLGWSADSRTLLYMVEEGGRVSHRSADQTGRSLSEVPAAGDNALGVVGSRVVEGTWPGRRIEGEEVRFALVDLATGSRREVASGIVDAETVAPGGTATDLFYYMRETPGGFELRAFDEGGADRRITDLPASAVSRPKAVGVGRVAWLDFDGDSAFLTLKTDGAPGRRVHTYDRREAGEYVWSPDGRQFVVSLGEGQEMDLFRFDDQGRPEGPPRRVSLPVRYQYQMKWLPDGSGLTMIAQLADQPWTHVILVRWSDPGNPVVLTRGDQRAKWGYVLSPDGRWVAYQSEVAKGGTAWLVDIEAALREARRSR